MNGQPYPLLDLFSGYGGFSLAFEAVVGHAHRAGRQAVGPRAERDGSGDEIVLSGAFRTIGFSEIEPYACALLAHRFPGVPNLGPVQSVTRDRVLRECGVLPVVVTGGFPCQPHSTAGKRLAGADDRDLWAECVRVLREFRPRVAVFENVPGLLTSKSPAPDGRDGKGLFFNRVLSDLAEIGFACAWETLSAAQVGAPHKRDRIWLLCVDERGVADSEGERAGGRSGVRRAERGPGRALLGQSRATGEAGSVGQADTDSVGRIGPLTVEGEPNRGRRGERGDATPRGGTDGAFWPAAHGLWPARPGEVQYEWEPPRVVGHAAGARRQGAENTGTGRGDADEGSGREESQRAGGLGDPDGGRREQCDPDLGGLPVADEAGRQAQPVVGRDVNGPAAGPHATAAEVREAPADTVNRTHRLKALGNGIVPLCALPFALAIYRALEESCAAS